MRFLPLRVVLLFLSLLFSVAALSAADQNFHNAPPSAKNDKNPFEGQASAAIAGKPLYARNCLSCHGKAGKGTGNVPSLVGGKLENVSAGEVFWFITHGDKANGMPAWGFLPAEKRWHASHRALPQLRQ